MHILLVEDELHVRKALASALRGWSHEVTECATAAAAIAAIADRAVDLLVLDINLPDATGWDVLRHRSHTLNADTPVIVISAIPPSVIRVREFRPMGVLYKPFALESLANLVERTGDKDAMVDSPGRGGFDD